MVLFADRFIRPGTRCKTDASLSQLGQLRRFFVHSRSVAYTYTCTMPLRGAGDEVMIVSEGRLAGVKLIEPTVFADSRGFFMESYTEELYRACGVEARFVQDNHSLSVQRGVLRGLHYQLDPMGQTKLVRVTAGAIWDVVVDIRHGSPTFGQWEAFELTAENKRQLLVPRGFAHGFCTLCENTEVLYKVDAPYSRPHDRGIAWNDPALAIEWPEELVPILSEKDAAHPLLSDAEINFIYDGSGKGGA